MKKYIIGILSLIALFYATSCVKEDIPSAGLEDEVTVTFSTNLSTDTKSKAVGNDANHINQLEIAVYKVSSDGTNTTNEYLPDLYKKVESYKSGDVIELRLAKGVKYRVAFWAQDANYKAYSFNGETATVTIDNNQVNANDRSGDAFFFATVPFEAQNAFNENISLERPFAQVNFLISASNLETVIDNIGTTTSGITVKNTATQLNILDGTVSGNEQTEFKMKELLRNNSTGTLESLEINSTLYYYIATAYVLPSDTDIDGNADEAIQTNISMNIQGWNPITAEDVTVQRNRRTNI